MRAFIKPGRTGKLKDFEAQWVDIDTSFLSTDQYNTTEEYGSIHIHDSDVERIEDDERVNKGRCKYCGAIISRGEEQQHFDEKRNKVCDPKNLDQKCFYCHAKPIGDATKTIATDPTNPNRYTEATIRDYEYQCTYDKDSYNNSASCNYLECEKRGIEWFTPDNTFFLAYPNGWTPYLTNLKIKDMDIIEHPDFNIRNKEYNAHYYKMGHSITYRYKKPLKSYTLDLILRKYDDEKAIILNCYIENARTHLRFNYDIKKDIFIKYTGCANSPRLEKILLPETTATAIEVNRMVKEIIKSIITEERYE